MGNQEINNYSVKIPFIGLTPRNFRMMTKKVLRGERERVHSLVESFDFFSRNNFEDNFFYPKQM